MNELIAISRSGALEKRDFDKSPVPLAIYPDLTKRKGTIFLVNKHIDLEILFITNGKLKIHLDNDTFVAGAGDIVVVNPDVLHNIIPLTESVTYDCIVIERAFLENQGLSLKSMHINEIIKDQSAFQFITDIKDTLMVNNQGYYVAKINKYLIELTVFLLENHARNKDTPSNTDNGLVAVENSIKYINKHLSEQLSLDDIAEYVGYSKFYFCRMFKSTTGYTVATYVNMQRIKYAHTLLTEGEENVSEVAAKCGFKSVSYFSTTYKKYVGYNPSTKKVM